MNHIPVVSQESIFAQGRRQYLRANRNQRASNSQPYAPAKFELIVVLTLADDQVGDEEVTIQNSNNRVNLLPKSSRIWNLENAIKIPSPTLLGNVPTRVAETLEPWYS